MTTILELLQCVTNATTMLQLMYNICACDHVMCLHFHCPLYDTFVIMTPIDTTTSATSALVLNY